jgi:hypothetical protein
MHDSRMLIFLMNTIMSHNRYFIKFFIYRNRHPPGSRWSNSVRLCRLDHPCVCVGYFAHLCPCVIIFALHVCGIGRHLQFYLESDEQSSSGNEPFIVPYTDIRESIGQTQALFAHAWQASLKAASDDYLHRVRVLWEKVFDDLFKSSDRVEHLCRGMPLDKAISLYVSTLDDSRSRDLLTTIKRIHSAASMNVEAFRKLVKKFDKGAIARGDDMLTSTLIPELYSAPLMAYPTLEGPIETLRDSLAVEDDSETEVDDDSIMLSIRRKTALVTKDSADVRRRADELSWLHDMLASIPSSEFPGLVAHRGEHNVYGCHGFLETPFFYLHVPKTNRVSLSSGQQREAATREFSFGI